MNHADFANLLPSEKRSLIEAAVAGLAFPARLVTFSSGASGTHTYATVELSGHRDGKDEYVTWLVCPQNLTLNALSAVREVDSGRVYLNSGNYGFAHERDAVEDMFDRANR